MGRATSAGAGPTSEREHGGRPYDVRHAERRVRLIEAGKEAFGAAGFFGTSIEGLCASARVSNRSFYEHFQSKEDLLLAVYDELLERVLVRVVAALARVADDPRTFVKNGLHAFVLGRDGDELHAH